MKHKNFEIARPLTALAPIHPDFPNLLFPDFRFSEATFADTTIGVEPVSEAGWKAWKEHFRAGEAISWTIKKSGIDEFAAAVEELGLTIY